MAAVPAAEEKDTGERRVLQEKPGLQTGSRMEELTGQRREARGAGHVLLLKRTWQFEVFKGEAS